MQSFLTSPVLDLGRARRALLAAAVLPVLLLAGCNRGKTAPAATAPPPNAVAPASASDPDARTFEKKEWLDSCMKSCRKSAPMRLPSLSPPDRELHCTLSCGCGLTHMTDPGPGPTQVHAPSVRWQSETPDQHQAGVKACIDRATAEVNASHGHPG